MKITKISRDALSEIIISPDTQLSDVLPKLEQSELKIILVEDPSSRLVGTITDGDVRRGLIKGFTMETSIEQFMNTNFSFVFSETSVADVNKKIHSGRLVAVPELSAPEKKTIALYIANSSDNSQELPNSAVIMAGGLGQRMKAHTLDLPKPLLTVGNATLIDHALDRCTSAGIRKFYISVNYLKEKIIEYLGDGSERDIEITYLIETQRLGTAGALSLLDEVPQLPFVVLNADVLHKTELRKLINFHYNEVAFATVGARQYESQIPFGVLRTDGGEVTEILEKPVETHLVNAGIYVFNPEVVSYVPKSTYLDMPDLLESLISDSKKIVPFPVHEYWLDVGNPESLFLANQEWQ